MKKKYEKPMIAINRFDLQQNIAATCGFKPGGSFGGPTQNDKSNCGWGFGNITAWISPPSCDYLLKEEDVFDGVCYNNPNGGTHIFSS